MSASAAPPLEVSSDVLFGSGVFRCQLAPDGARSASLQLSGELDLATCGDLRAALLAAEESSPVVSVELAELQFIDSSGLAALAEAAARMAKAGKKLVLVGGEGQVQRVLDLVGSLGEAERRRHAPLRFLGDAEAQRGGSPDVV